MFLKEKFETKALLFQKCQKALSGIVNNENK